MAQRNTGTIIFLAIFMVLTIAIGIFWGISHSDASAKLAELDKARKDKTTADATIRQLTQERETLLALIGREGEGDANAVATELDERLASARLSDLTDGARSMELALDKAATNRDMQAGAANSRQVDLQNKIDELQQMIVSKDDEIKTHREGREAAERELSEQQARHSEEIARLDEENGEVNRRLRAVQEDLDAYTTETDRTIALLNNDNREKRAAVRALRRRLFEKDDVSFATADGLISSVDQISQRVYINLGLKDELQVGTTFSVYMASHNGIGRRDSSDIKASIEVISVSGPHVAEARITRQDLERPVAKGDPIYSPIFTAGLPVEVAVAGLIDFDGSPGTDRDELLRMITDRGAKVTVQVGDDGQFITRSGESMTEQEATNAISETTRFLVIADLGKDVDEEDVNETRLLTFREIQRNTGLLQRQAENHGVYEIGLSAFLEFLGYTRKRTAWRAGQTFKAVLPNGAKSASVDAATGNRISTGTVSQKYTTRRRYSNTSQGAVSELFKNGG